MADVDPNSIPFVPTTDVSLIDITTGKPKTAMHDWMSAIFDWMKRSVVDLTTKITTLVFQQGELEASITEEAFIRETEDGVLAASILTVDAKANNATANGQVFLAAKAAPSGATAAYGVYLTAGSAFTGLEMLAESGGGSAIGLSATRLLFTNSGTGQQVFDYDGTSFIFTVPIVIRSAASGERAELDNQGLRVYYASGQLALRAGIWP